MATSSTSTGVPAAAVAADRALEKVLTHVSASSSMASESLSPINRVGVSIGERVPRAAVAADRDLEKVLTHSSVDTHSEASEAFSLFDAVSESFSALRDQKRVTTTLAYTKNSYTLDRGIQNDDNTCSHPQNRPGAIAVPGIAGEALPWRSLRSPAFCSSGEESVDLQTATNSVDTRSTSSNSSLDIESLVTADPVSEEFDISQVFQAAKAVDPKVLSKRKIAKQRQEKIIQGCTLALSCLALVPVIILGFVFGLGGEHEDVMTTTSSLPPMESPTSSPTNNAMDVLLLGLPTDSQEQIQIFGTPQQQAWDWLANHPNITGYPDWRMIQLFALATFFYAMEGPHWREEIRDNWMLYDTPECYWYSSSYGEFGDAAYIQREREPYTSDEIGHFDYSTTAGYTTNRESLPDQNIPPCNDQGVIEALLMNNLLLDDFEPTIPPEIALLTSLSFFALRRNGHSGSLDYWVPSELLHMPNLTFLALNNNKGMAGPLPSDLVKMTQLQHLHLDDCSFTGPIPTEFGSMTNIESLFLYKNQLTGTIPSQIGMLSSMEYFQAYEMGLSGTIPSSLAHATSLKQLLLYGGELMGTLPLELTHLTALKDLEIDNNALTGPIITEMGLLTNLLRFDFKLNQLTGQLPSQLGALTQLTRINGGWNNLEGSLPTQVGLLVNMKKFYFEESNLSGPIPSGVGMMLNNTRFYVQDSRHTGTIPMEFWQQTMLGKIRFHGNQFSGSLPPSIGALTDLYSWHLYDNGFSGSVPTEIGKMTSLEEFVAHHNFFIGQLPSELGRLSLLERLELQNTSISGSIPSQLGMLVVNGSLETLRLGEGLAGSVPNELCFLGHYNSSADNPTGLEFSCGKQLCGCDWCICGSDT